MISLWIAALPLSLAAASAPSALPPLDCDHVEERNATVPAGGAELLRVAARSGQLRIEGRAGITEVRVRGRACASSRDHLAGIRLVAVREGSTVRVEAQMPEMRGIGYHEARLDLVIEVPTGLAADVTDSSGDAEFRDLASLRLVDSSGGVRIEGIAGDIHVEDNSGDVEIRRAGANVWLSDSSGALTVDGAQGSVMVEEDSSGDIDIDDVRGDVTVRRDSSGSISVARVGGDFTVSRDGSGGIEHREIAGAVRVPGRKR